MDANSDVAEILDSPVFSKFAFPSGGTTQYADALLRSTFPAASEWHTLLGKPEILRVTISVPVGFGYILTSKKTGRSFAIADIEFPQKEIFRQLRKQEGKLVIAITHNTAYYALGDATVCCSGERMGSILLLAPHSCSAHTFTTHLRLSRTAIYNL